VIVVADAIRDRLVAETRLRCGRGRFVDGPRGRELEWVLAERAFMVAETNRWRAVHGLSPVGADRVEWAERQAEGHIDYAGKWALYCAQIGVGEERARG